MLVRALFPCLLAVLLTAAGCQSSSPAAPGRLVAARFFIEARPGEQGLPVRLPTSGVALQVDPRPVFLEFDIASVQRVDSEFGPGLMFFLTAGAARDLYRLSASAQGRRLVTALNGTVVAATPFAGPVTSGAVLVYPEVGDADLAQLAAEINRTSAEIERQRAKRR